MVKRLLSVDVNGRAREDAVADDRLLLDYLREDVGFTGTKRGCDGGECGACTVLVDGEPALACITLAVRCQGRRVETIDTPGATLSGWRLLMMMLEHGVHHRSQIDTYAGLQGWPVPDIFGRSAESIAAREPEQRARHRH